jgi:hypothetical protein
VDVTAEDFRRHYELLSDEALLEVDTGELVELARTCHAEEVARRGLAEGNGHDGEQAVVAADSGTSAPPDEIVCIVEYDHLDEADLARGLLEAAEIPASLESEPGVVRLMVPAKFAEHALGMLATPLSDEDLAAQAEAAGFDAEEEELEEDPEE